MESAPSRPESRAGERTWSAAIHESEMKYMRRACFLRVGRSVSARSFETELVKRAHPLVGTVTSSLTVKVRDTVTFLIDRSARVDGSPTTTHQLSPTQGESESVPGWTGAQKRTLGHREEGGRDDGVDLVVLVNFAFFSGWVSMSFAVRQGGRRTQSDGEAEGRACGDVARVLDLVRQLDPGVTSSRQKGSVK